MLAADPAYAADINRHLVRNGVDVRDLTPVHASLEEVFLRLAQEEGGNSHG